MQSREGKGEESHHSFRTFQRVCEPPPSAPELRAELKRKAPCRPVTTNEDCAVPDNPATLFAYAHRSAFSTWGPLA